MFLFMEYLQLNGVKERGSKTNAIIESVNSTWYKIKSVVLVDLEEFPEKGHRFTAIYSRDREYL